jgi:hypothetical protein
MHMRVAEPKLPFATKIALTGRIWSTFLSVRGRVDDHPLPELVHRLERSGRVAELHVQPKRLGMIVARVLRLGPWRARCLFTSLVLYRLLYEQGDSPVLVIGLPERPKEKDAHAWIELDGSDVGPPPGKGRHEPIARYP